MDKPAITCGAALEHGGHAVIQRALLETRAALQDLIYAMHAPERRFDALKKAREVDKRYLDLAFDLGEIPF